MTYFANTLDKQHKQKHLSSLAAGENTFFEKAQNSIKKQQKLLRYIDVPYFPTD